MLHLKILFIVTNLSTPGPVCCDPGHPVDGRQVATSYEAGQVVTMTCNKPGYTPYPDEITCHVNGSDANWSDTTLLCIGNAKLYTGSLIAVSLLILNS